MTTKIRLYFSDKIQSEIISYLTREQSHYVKDVMRLKTGDSFSVFNDQGEWNAIIESYEKDGAVVGLADGILFADDKKIYEAENLKVGLFK